MTSSLLTIAMLAVVTAARNVKTTTPLMGWNSYNAFSCSPTEDIIKTNAKGLVDLGFDRLGYTYVTPDCGWDANYRDSSGKKVWNPKTFPSGGKALGDYIHSLGLKFGVYSGAGYYQCGSTDLPGSLSEYKFILYVFFRWHKLI